jgi:hypothetical protein
MDIKQNWNPKSTYCTTATIGTAAAAGRKFRAAPTFFFLGAARLPLLFAVGLRFPAVA